MTTSEMVREYLEDTNPEAAFADGFDEAILGVAIPFGQDQVVAYDSWKCIRILMKRDGMSREEAGEFFDFNILGAYVKGNPIFVWIPKSNRD